MAKRILVPVLPSERFYEAVVAAGDLIAAEGGIFTFLFTTVRPPPQDVDTEAVITPDPADATVIDAWQDQMVAALDDARDLLYERGIEDSQLNYLFADYETTPAQSIADEAAAGAYDLVVIARGYFVYLPDQPGESPTDLVEAVNSLRDDGVRLLVT